MTLPALATLLRWLSRSVFVPILFFYCDLFSDLWLLF